MSLKINWQSFDGQFAQQVIEQVNSLIAQELEKKRDTLPKEFGLNYFQILSLDWGSTAPDIIVKNIQDGYSDEEFAQLIERETVNHQKHQQQQQKSKKEQHSQHHQHPQGLQVQTPSNNNNVSQNNNNQNGDSHSVFSNASSQILGGLGATSKASVLIKLRAMQQAKKMQQQQQHISNQSLQQQQLLPPMETNPLAISAELSHPELLVSATKSTVNSIKYVKTKHGAYSISSSPVAQLANQQQQPLDQQQQQQQQQQHQEHQVFGINSLQKPLLPTRICSMYNHSSSSGYKWVNRKAVQDKALNNIPIFQEQEKNNVREPKSLFDMDYICGDKGLLLTVHFHYNGNANIALATEVAVNIPVPNFVTYPVNVKLGHIVVEGELNIMYKKDKVYVFFARPVREPFSPIKDFSLIVEFGDATATEGGDPQPSVYAEKSKIEALIKQQLDRVIRRYLVLPNFYCVDQVSKNLPQQ